MTTPLGIADLMESVRAVALGDHAPVSGPKVDHWYWCRRHEQVHKFGEKCEGEPIYPGEAGYRFSDKSGDAPAASGACIDIGPFMSEREANRCIGQNVYWAKPLGMEIEV